MLATFFYFILALLLLVTVHEYGHFLVARCCGVKVLRFSFGFGKVLLRYVDKKGTEYAFSALPFGGYIKMLDEDEAPVAPEDRASAFNNLHPAAKMMVASAGPLFNFLFAFLAFWLVSVVGMQSLAPIIHQVAPGSIAAHAGLSAQEEIIALNGTRVESVRDFQYALAPLIGTKAPFSVTVKSLIDNQRTTHMLDLSQMQLDSRNPDVLKSLGLQMFMPHVPAVVGEVMSDTPASLAGFQAGDHVKSVDGQRVKDWLDVVAIVKRNPGKKMDFSIMRHGSMQTVPVTLGVSHSDGRAEGMLGVRSQEVKWPKHWLRMQRLGPIAAVEPALMQTIQLTKTTFVLMGRLASGTLSWQGISGPVGIAKGAGDSARSGFSYYLSFLALVSISLGALNLLPIPLLDGGHILFYGIELLRRKPLTAKLRSACVTVGFLLLMALMVLAVTNDIGRLTNYF